RDRISGSIPSDGSASLSAGQWKNVAKVVADAGRVSNDFGLDLVFHPHIATYVETPEEVEHLYDVTSATNMGLRLDTGHCVYGGGDPVAEAEKYRSILRYVHIKDISDNIMSEARRKALTFDQAIEEKVFTIIGQGSIDFPKFFQVLARNGYSGWMVVEQDVKFGATVIPPAVSIAQSLNHLRGVVNQMTAAAVS